MGNNAVRLQRDLLDDGDARDRRAERPPLRLDRSIDWGTRLSLHRHGQVFDCAVPVARFPGWIAGLLCGRRNEWLIVGFARGQRVHRVFANEGSPDEVEGFARHEDILATAHRLRSDLVAMVHNHPHTHASRVYSLPLNRPSPGDLAVAREIGERLRARGVAHLALVCVDGIAYEYYWRIPPDEPHQLEFSDVFGGEPVHRTRDDERELDGRFIERVSPWAKARIWPRALRAD